MSQFNVVKNSTNPDQIYFDLTITNFASTTTQPPVFYFDETRTTPFIENPEDYFLSVVRFSVETTTIPVMIASITPKQNNTNLTIYSVTLSYGNYTAQQSVIWSPQDTSIIPPPAPQYTSNGLQFNDSGYYNAYSYEWFIGLINKAFSDAFATLTTAAGGTLPTTYAPFLQWDSTSNSAILVGDVAGYNSLGSSAYIKIYMNAPLFTYFNSFPSTILGYTNVTNGKNFQLRLGNNNFSNLQTITLSAPGATVVQYSAMSLYQECSVLPNWTPVTSLVFTSGTLPVVPNQVSTPLVYNNNQQIALGGNNSAIANIVTDLIDQSGQYRSRVDYLPTAEYRLITLRGNQPLKNIDLQIFYRIKTGQLIPFRIGSGESVTMKIAFLKKESIQISHQLNSSLPTTTIKPNQYNATLMPNYTG